MVSYPLNRKSGAGIKGKLPTMADKLKFVLYYYKTYPTFDVLAAQFDMVRSKANENLHKLSPILYDTLVQLELMPYRELETPKALRKALEGVDNSSSMRLNVPIVGHKTMPPSVSLRVKKKPYAEKHRHGDVRYIHRVSGSYL